MEYKDTLNLPKTDFSMKANLAQNEPKIMAAWNTVYCEVRKKNQQKKKFVLHDGPPYANGLIHLGHALNKILKDIVLKFRTMEGHSSTYIPGWDCHGLPVEHQLLKELKKSKHQVDIVDFRKKAREYALKYVKLQKDDFIRLGIFGEWEKPYLTLQPEYEARVLEVLLSLVEKGYVYRNLRPVNWCMRCETALAEAEIEYNDKQSFSLYCTFELKASERIKAVAGKKKAYLLVWTTTPWTLVSNVAVAVHPDFEYVIAERADDYLIFAKDLIDVIKEKGVGEFRVVGQVWGKDLDRSKAVHPFMARESLVINASFVVKNEGTGCVHIAPGHGADDFKAGQQYGLPILMPVDDKGFFTKDAGIFEGKNVINAQEEIIALLKEKQRLVHVDTITHSYPFCWRCKSAIIFRSTYQWFLNIEHQQLRSRLLNEMDSIGWYPSSGKERMASMLSTRPDWCLSRQRLWGIPIPAVRCKACRTVILDPKIIGPFIQKVREMGTDSWFEQPLTAFIPQGFTCPQCKKEEFEKEADILDVWFESGASFNAVCKANPALSFPADLYLEGSDQHRGWFQVSYILSMSTENIAAFKNILTHGFVVDGEGKKMSKSQGNVVSPQEMVKKYGADILRLWVASSDYQEDIRISTGIVEQLVEQYRKIRNTVRFLLANIYDFKADQDALTVQQLLPLDRYMLYKAQKLFADVRGCYQRYEFYKVTQKLYGFCNIELSSFYMDILKDTLYTHYKTSTERRSAQTVLWATADMLIKAMSPILSFTAEDAYTHFKAAQGGQSVFMQDWQLPLEVPAGMIDEQEWERLFALREKVLKELENFRSKGTIGSPLEARLTIQCAESKEYQFFESRIPLIKTLCIVSQVMVEKSPQDAITVDKASGKKCQRCWVFTDDAEDARYAGLCHKCVAVMEKSVKGV